MATIRVSSLPEIKVDRITDDDYYIVNDGDITTSKLAFKQMVLGIAQKDIDFSGTIKFSGNVEFDGTATGPFPNDGDVYTTDEIDVKIKVLEDKDSAQDLVVSDLISLTGETAGSVVHNSFPKGIITGSPTTRGALIDLEQNIFDNNASIADLISSKNSNDQDVADLNAALTDLETDVARVSDDLIALETRVGVSETTIIDHGLRIIENEKAVGELSKREFFFEALGYTEAYRNNATAAAGGVAIGDVYVQSPTARLTDGVLKTRMS